LSLFAYLDRFSPAPATQNDREECRLGRFHDPNDLADAADVNAACAPPLRP
jgi:hypothetical protein